MTNEFGFKYGMQRLNFDDATSTRTKVTLFTYDNASS